VARFPKAALAVEVAPLLANEPVQAGALAWARQRSARFVREAAREGKLEQDRLAGDRIVMKGEVRPALSAARVV
jgi:hypothetical protein